jgi:hypothetical protein
MAVTTPLLGDAVLVDATGGTPPQRLDLPRYNCLGDPAGKASHTGSICLWCRLARCGYWSGLVALPGVFAESVFGIGASICICVPQRGHSRHEGG